MNNTIKPLPNGDFEVLTDTQRPDSQQVLKAEAARPDATAREIPAHASPRVGAMGAGQAADAAPAGRCPFPQGCLNTVAQRTLCVYCRPRTA